MNTINIFAEELRAVPLVPARPVARSDEQPSMRVKELCERDRRLLLMHLLDLDDNDRLLRFRSVLSDEMITKYVQKLNFMRDAVFGVYDSNLRLLGAGHLAFLPRETFPAVKKTTNKKSIAEFGVSVSNASRNIGVGSRLFERAAIHCRNADVDTLYVHCVASVQATKNFEKKTGVTVLREHGYAGAYVKLPTHLGGLEKRAS